MEGFGRQVETAAARREPALRAPWSVLTLVGLIVLAMLAQALWLTPQGAAARFGVSGEALRAGRWSSLATALFVHAGWTHALLNAVAALAFGAPVARMLGVRATGGLLFLLFYLLCGALASLAYSGLAPDATLIGASGAVSGLMGFASRVSPHAPGRLLPLHAPPVLAMAAGWLVVNLVIAAAGLDLGTAGAPVAWQAHIAGYAAGVALAPAFRALAAVIRSGGG